MQQITASQAAEELGVTHRRVLAMIQAGRLKAQKLGNMWVIRRADLDAVRDRSPGRPPSKKKAAARKRK